MQDGSQGGELLDESLNLVAVRRLPNVQGATLGQEAPLPQVPARGHGQRKDARAAVGLFPERGGTAGGVVAGGVLRLDQQHAGMGRAFGGETGACHPGANDGDVKISGEDGHAASASAPGAMRSRKSSIAAMTLSLTGSASRSNS